MLIISPATAGAVLSIQLSPPQPVGMLSVSYLYGGKMETNTLKVEALYPRSGLISQSTSSDALVEASSTTLFAHVFYMPMGCGGLC